MDCHSLKEKVQIQYPALLINGGDTTTPFIISTLKDGNIPLLLNRDGVTVKVKSISKDILGINALINSSLSNITLLTETGEYNIETLDDLINEGSLFKC